MEIKRYALRQHIAHSAERDLWRNDNMHGPATHQEAEPFASHVRRMASRELGEIGGREGRDRASTTLTFGPVGLAADEIGDPCTRLEEFRDSRLHYILGHPSRPKMGVTLASRLALPSRIIRLVASISRK